MSDVERAQYLMRDTFQLIDRAYNSDAPPGWRGHSATEPLILGVAMGRAVCLLGGVEVSDEAFMTGLVKMLQTDPPITVGEST